MEERSPKKLQFMAPDQQEHLDPQALEQIRRRRPTPACLVLPELPFPTGQDESPEDSGSDATPTDFLSTPRKCSTNAPPSLKAAESKVSSVDRGAANSSNNRPHSTVALAMESIQGDTSSNSYAIEELRIDHASERQKVCAETYVGGIVEAELQHEGERQGKPRRKDTPIYQSAPVLPGHRDKDNARGLVDEESENSS
uniref:protein phosphatase 1 regulatory subunit 1B-like isoform X3 n=1 Tax=Myxine glutinosa TaxID=7769 RepID=UPI00358E4609